MKEKDIRAIQLEELKAGIFPATYNVITTTFDGRIISREPFESKADATIIYNARCKEWKQAASVRLTAEFTV